MRDKGGNGEDVGRVVGVLPSHADIDIVCGCLLEKAHHLIPWWAMKAKLTFIAVLKAVIGLDGKGGGGGSGGRPRVIPKRRIVRRTHKYLAAWNTGGGKKYGSRRASFDLNILGQGARTGASHSVEVFVQGELAVAFVLRARLNTRGGYVDVGEDVLAIQATGLGLLHKEKIVLRFARLILDRDRIGCHFERSFLTLKWGGDFGVLWL